MTPNPLSFDLGQSAYTERDASGFYRVQIDYYGDKGSHALEAYHPCGFVGRPRDPSTDPTGQTHVGATALYAWEGNQGHVIQLSDPRIAPKLPEVKRGGSMQYADRADGKVSYALFDGDAGAWTLLVQRASGSTSVVVDQTNVSLGGGDMKFIVTADLISWITTVLMPALATAPGGPISVTAPPANVVTQVTKAS